MKHFYPLLYGFVLIGLCACSIKRDERANIPREPLEIQTYTAGEGGFLANSYLIMAVEEALLVDTPFTKQDSEKLSDMIRRAGRKLKYIYISQAHPDHYLGLATLRANFPEARIVALPEVALAIKENGEADKTYWKSLYGENINDEIVVPTDFTEDKIMIGGNALELMKFAISKGFRSAGIFVPPLKTLVAGDWVFNRIHLRLGDRNIDPDAWIKLLKDLSKKEEIETILPGHGKKAGPLVFEQNKKYIETFLEVLDKAETPEDAIAEMRNQYPEYLMPVLLEISVRQRFKKTTQFDEKKALEPLIYQ